SGTFQAVYADAVDPTDTGMANGTVNVPVAQQSTPDTVVSASQSSMTVSPTSVPANNASTTMVTVTVKNAVGSPLSGKNVTLTSSRPSSDTMEVLSLNQTSMTDASGVVFYTVRSTTDGTSTFTATVDSVTLTGSVTFTAVSVSSSDQPVTPIGEATTSSTDSSISGTVSGGTTSTEGTTGGTPVVVPEVEAPGPTYTEEEIQQAVNLAVVQQSTQVESVGYDTEVDDTRLNQLSVLGLQIHALVKLPDDGDPDTQADSAVYYIGADGKRHAFPNEKVFRSWFCDFSTVRELSPTELASVQLGSNVTYIPGKRMVKFTTNDKVYVVDKGGILRWVTDSEFANTLYGESWNKKIDDISDAFFTNYKFGEDINDIADYNAVAVERTVTYPSDSMRIQGYVESAPRPAIEGCAVIDSDKDGVSDDAEKAQGTNPLKADTDNDGLTDGEEKIKGTDPLKADTDGDGFDDKTELDNGYNPNGPGTL
ncbi:MAG: Ig-like domain-containing protein, partial [bacterium]|nr:Ig-like domain-containing protein [bacterium]